MSDISEIPFQDIIAALQDENTPINPRYLYRLSDLSNEEIVAIKETWPKMPAWRRQALLEDLEELGEADDLLSFEAVGRHAVNDSDSRVRLLSVRLLWVIEDQDLIPVFINLAEADPEDAVRAAAAAGLGQFVYLGEIEELTEERSTDLENRLLRIIAQDQNPQVRRKALESVSYASRDEIPELIEQAFASGDKEWMATALIAMGHSVDERWREKVKSMLDDKSPVLRAEAARAAGELEIADAVEPLIDLTEDGDEDVREAAIWSLSQIGGESARLALEDLLRQTDDEDEAEYLEVALDNLAFTDGMQRFSLLDFPEDKAESEMYARLMPEGDEWEFVDEEDYLFLEDEEGFEDEEDSFQDFDEFEDDEDRPA